MREEIGEEETGSGNKKMGGYQMSKEEWTNAEYRREQMTIAKSQKLVGSANKSIKLMRTLKNNKNKTKKHGILFQQRSRGRVCRGFLHCVITCVSYNVCIE